MHSQAAKPVPFFIIDKREQYTLRREVYADRRASRSQAITAPLHLYFDLVISRPCAQAQGAGRSPN